MHKLSAAIRKEILLLTRDLPGLLILFLMPLILIMIVTVAQENEGKDSRARKTDILFLDLSHSRLSEEISRSLSNSGIFRIINEYEHKPVTEQITTELIIKGEYEVAVRIGEKDSFPCGWAGLRGFTGGLRSKRGA